MKTCIAQYNAGTPAKKGLIIPVLPKYDEKGNITNEKIYPPHDKKNFYIIKGEKYKVHERVMKMLVRDGEDSKGLPQFKPVFKESINEKK